MEAPSDLPAFLDWLRMRTEEAWSMAEPATLADYGRRGVGGAEAQRGTRWKPLGSEELTAIETREGPLPPSLRVYLLHLGGTDRPQVGAAYRGATLERVERPLFYDWRDASSIEEAREAVLSGLEFDAEQGWWPASSVRPATAIERRQQLAAILAAAPKLWPIVGHRHLVGDAVLSIHQSDIILWGRDLRSALLRELASVVGRTNQVFDAELPPIPFWGDF